MDLDTYSRREEELALASRLLEAERERLLGAKGYTVDEFKANMQRAIQEGARHGA
jgi:hypothetical protein